MFAQHVYESADPVVFGTSSEMPDITSAGFPVQGRIKFDLRTRIIIGCAFISGAVSASVLAAQFQCDISYIYRLGRLADSFLDACAPDEYETASGFIPITKQFIEASVVSLRVVCQASEEDTVRFIKMIYQEDICVSTVSNITRRYGEAAIQWNQSVPLQNVVIGANDEIFFGQAQKQMILAGVDLKSTFIYGMCLSPDRKADTWSLFMMCLQDQGLNLGVSISDAGSSLIKGVANAFPACFMQLDVFHTLKDLGTPIIALERKACALLEDMYSKELALTGPKPRQKTRSEYETLASAIDDVLVKVDTLLLLYSWVRELLDFTGYSRRETEDLLYWIVSEMRRIIDGGSGAVQISFAKLKHELDVFQKRIRESLSFIDYVYRELDAASSRLGVDVHAAHLLYRLRSLPSSSSEYGFMSRHIDHLLHGTRVTRQELEATVNSIVDYAEKASSMIENVNSRLRTALNDSRGMNVYYMALLMMHMNTKEYRRSMVPERVGKSPYELLTGERISFMDILFPGFSPVMPIWKKSKRAA